MKPVISTQELSKTYGTVHAVDGLSITVGSGEIFGFLGLNGAGKTTTIRMLLGMIRPTRGAAYLFGDHVDARSRALWSRVGYLVETSTAYPELTVRENLEVARRLRQVTDRAVVKRVMADLALDEYADRKAKTLSQGNAQRLVLARALLHRPELLLLDEPSNGLDPAGVAEIRNLLQNLAAIEGVTILISSHILTEVARLATRIGIIHRGRLLEELDSQALEQRLRHRLIVGTLDPSAAQRILELAGYAVVSSDDGMLSVNNQDALEHPERIATLMVETGVPLTRLEVRKDDLETHFLQMVGDGGTAP